METENITMIIEEKTCELRKANDSNPPKRKEECLNPNCPVCISKKNTPASNKNNTLKEVKPSENTNSKNETVKNPVITKQVAFEKILKYLVIAANKNIFTSAQLIEIQKYIDVFKN